MQYLPRVPPWLCLLMLVWVGPAMAAGKLKVTDAWIRAAPPGAQVMAGYATLTNEGDTPLVILAVQSGDFRMAALHESLAEGGMAKMRELRRLVIAAGQTVQLAPGAKHLMLMQPRREVAAGDQVIVTFLLEDGARLDAHFDVLAPDASDAHAHE
ncbi:copper chaperone PCu(A)C [Dokdonella sp.]|uniref:copper chaperone PCu(A)C n=1 Tax=Dokdonella sp. TaxID=2291710 RepID=UPI0031BE2B93|nr:copper chaperone PCu(A)C [Dokdonella sp.]